MTEEEFQKIQQQLAMNQKVPKHTKRGKQPLSGLIYCGKCGKAMTSNIRESKKLKRTEHIIKKCQALLSDGSVCGNPGIKADIILESVIKWLDLYEEELKSEKTDKKKNLTEAEIQLKAMKKQFKKRQEEYENIVKLYSKRPSERLFQQIGKFDDELLKMENEIKRLQETILFNVPISLEEKRNNFKHFKENFDIRTLDNETANTLTNIGWFSCSAFQMPRIPWIPVNRNYGHVEINMGIFH